MKNYFLITIVCCFFTYQLEGTVYRVNNTGADADFTSLQDAHDAASPGDTLYVEASPTDYGTLTINKKIHIFGAGFFLGENINLQASVIPSSVNIINLGAGCDESTIQGMTVITVIQVTGNASFSDVIISRNNIFGGIYLSSTGLIEDVFIIQNFIEGSYNTYYSFRTAGDSNKNFVVMNNIFQYGSVYSYINLHGQTSATFVARIFKGDETNSQIIFCDN